MLPRQLPGSNEEHDESNIDDTLNNRVMFTIGQENESLRVARGIRTSSESGMATSENLFATMTSSFNKMKEYSATRSRTKSFSFREVKDRLLTKNNFKRAASLRKIDRSADEYVNEAVSLNLHNPSMPSIRRTNEEASLTDQENCKKGELEVSLTTTKVKRPDEIIRSHSFSLKRITTKLFSKSTVVHEQDAKQQLVERQFTDDGEHLEEAGNPEENLMVPLPQEYAQIDSPEEVVPRMRPKSQSWSHADVVSKIRRSASTRSANISVRSDGTDNTTGIGGRKNAEKLIQKKPFLKRILLPIRRAVEDDEEGSSHLLKCPPTITEFEEPLTEMRPKSKSFSNTSEISRPKKIFKRQCSTEARVNVPSSCNFDDLLDAIPYSGGHVELRIPRSASCTFPDHVTCYPGRFRRRRNALSTSCLPLYLPTQIRFTLSKKSINAPLSDEFVALLNEALHKHRSARSGVTRNTVKTLFRRIFIRKARSDDKWGESLPPRKREKQLPELETTRNDRPVKNLVVRPIDKRFDRFQQLFGKIIGEADELIAAYSCALRSEVLSQGHLYISQRNVAFYSKSLKWEIRFIIPFSKITRITKEKTAKVLPNAVLIETCDAEKYFFTSFTQRDKSFILLFHIWQCHIDGATVVPADLWDLRYAADGHIEASSNAKSEFPVDILKLMALNPPTVEESSQNNTLKVDTSPWGRSLKPSKRMSESMVSSKNSGTNMSDSAIGCSDLDLARNSSAYSLDSEHSGALNESSDEASNISEGDFSIDVKVSCPCRSHVGRVLLDEIFRLSPEQLFEILFSEVPWYRQFASIVKETAQSRLFDSISGYMASPWITNQTVPTSSTRTATYTMALNHAMAPKCTIVTEKQECTEFERLSEGFVVMKESQNAGIPYAESFLIQCTYCITRVSPRHSRLLIHGGIIYKKNIWGIVRGYIERSTYAGLEDHYAALEETLKVHCERNADASSCCSDLSTQRFNDKQLVDRRLQHPSDIDVLNSREYEHEEASSTIAARVAANINSVPPRGLRLRLRTATEEAQTQTMPIMVTSDLTYYARLIITLLTTLILLHIFTLLKLSSTETPQRCSIKDRFADMLAWNSDTTTVANLMQLDSTEKTQSSIARLPATVDRIHKRLGQAHGIWPPPDET